MKYSFSDTIPVKPTFKDGDVYVSPLGVHTIMFLNTENCCGYLGMSLEGPSSNSLKLVYISDLYGWKRVNARQHTLTWDTE